MFNALIGFLLSNFTLTFLVIGLVAGGMALVWQDKSRPPIGAIEPFLAYFLLFSVGFSFLYNFVMHVFFGELAAHFIGWQQSPFQAEVGFASLGFAVVGFLAFRGSFGLRLAAITGPAFFQLGAAVGHVYQIETVGNFAPGNAGVMLYSDFLLPIIGFTLLWLRYRSQELALKTSS